MVVGSGRDKNGWGVGGGGGGESRDRGDIWSDRGGTYGEGVRVT